MEEKKRGEKKKREKEMPCVEDKKRGKKRKKEEGNVITIFSQ